MAFAKVSVYVPELIQHVSGLSSSAPLILPLGLHCHYACTFYALICIRISLKLYFLTYSHGSLCMLGFLKDQLILNKNKYQISDWPAECWLMYH